ncbi:MAG: hypothetical protein WCX75_08415 [Fibrobacteraceae bacterium]
MKIRVAFVTNSSSVSYIVSWSPEIAEFIRLKSELYQGDVKKNRIYNLLTEDLNELPRSKLRGIKTKGKALI